jgi:DNA-binding transcriptional MerR regulator
MLRIGEFSKMSKTTIKALRYYDEVGLLKPEETDKFTGYRFYTTNQLVKLHRIQAYRQVGLSIDEIRLILSGHDAAPMLEKRMTELKSELAEGTSQLSRIEFILQGKGENHFMNYAVTIKELPGCIVYSKKMTIPTYDAYFEVIPAIGEAVEKQYPDLKCAVPEYSFVVYLDGEYREKDINIEFCEAVTKKWPDFSDIVFKDIDPATVVSVLHKGSYKELSQAYAYTFKWIEENGYIPASHPRESYIDGIWNKEDEADWLTELQVPIVKR